MTSRTYPVIIVGAGIGGLSAAAYLSKLGIRSLLLERADFPGGRCSTRMINGQPYEIGALYIGDGAFERLQKTFGIACKPIPIRCGVLLGEHLASIPLGWRTVFELHRCGAKWTDLIGFLANLRLLSDPSTFDRVASVGGVCDLLTANPVIRRFLDALSGVSGVSPYQLPSRYLSKNNPVVTYKTMNPGYMPSGNGAIPDLLLKVAEEKCDVMLGQEVTAVIIEDNRVAGVETPDGIFRSDIVVSNAGLQDSVLRLTSCENWSPDFLRTVDSLEESYRIVSVYFTFDRTIEIPKGFALFFVPYDVQEEFLALEQGRFPRDSMYILHVPTNIDPSSSGCHRATLQFYYPKGTVSDECLALQVRRVMSEGLERLCAGLSGAVTEYAVYDPDRYLREFGFSPHVFMIAPHLHHPRFPIRTELAGLYCVGDSVAPDGPCVPQAMESGIACARLIAERLGIPVPPDKGQQC